MSGDLMAEKYAVMQWVQRAMIDDRPALVGYLRALIEEGAGEDGYVISGDVTWVELKLMPGWTDERAEAMLSRGWVPVRAEAPVVMAGETP